MTGWLDALFAYTDTFDPEFRDEVAGAANTARGRAHVRRQRDGS